VTDDQPKVYSAQQVADELGISSSRVRRIARMLGIGQRIGQVWVFTAADVARLKAYPRTPGRPPTR